jgi:predicted DCC family thiol-disulfide oxidoreductase YuxK
MPEPIILFDGVCNLCNGGVNFIIDRDPRGVFKFASLQSDFGKRLVAKAEPPIEELSTIVLYDEGCFYRKSTAVLRIARRLTFPWSLATAFRLVPRFIRDVLYGVVVRNRYRWFGKSEQCRLPSPELKGRFLG